MIPKERQILFTVPNIRKIIRKIKTQTRRPLKKQPPPECLGFAKLGDEWLMQVPNTDEDTASKHPIAVVADVESRYNSPFGLPGDLLWIKEPHCFCTHGSYEPWERTRPAAKSWHEASVVYKAQYLSDPHDEYKGKWRSSLFMPRWAARVILEVGETKIERLSQISAEDAIKEGITHHDGLGVGHSGWKHDAGAVFESPQAAYFDLWKSIYSEESLKFDPWVFAVRFNLLEVRA